jgi:hypothetical protein
VSGTSFGDNLIASLPDVIGRTVGRAMVEGIEAAARSLRRENEIVVTQVPEPAAAITSPGQPIQLAAIFGNIASDAPQTMVDPFNGTCPANLTLHCTPVRPVDPSRMSATEISVELDRARVNLEDSGFANAPVIIANWERAYADAVERERPTPSLLQVGGACLSGAGNTLLNIATLVGDSWLSTVGRPFGMHDLSGFDVRLMDRFNNLTTTLSDPLNNILYPFGDTLDDLFLRDDARPLARLICGAGMGGAVGRVSGGAVGRLGAAGADDLAQAARAQRQADRANGPDRTGRSASRPSSRDGVDAAHLDELRANGVRFNVDEVVRTGRDPSGRVVWLETGDNRRGLTHIVNKHAEQFQGMGVGVDAIPELVMRAVTDGRLVGYQGRGTGRPIFEVDVNGTPRRLAVTVGSNGYIVGANPRSSRR